MDGRKNNGGGRINAGRKSYQDEIIKSKFIMKTWKWLEERWDKDELTKEQKLALAIDIVKKSIPQEINLKDDYADEKIDERIAELSREIAELRDGAESVKIEEVRDGGKEVETG